jgi:hypothetical protein
LGRSHPICKKSKWIFRYFISFYQKGFYPPTLNATKHSLAVAIRYGPAGNRGLLVKFLFSFTILLFLRPHRFLKPVRSILKSIFLVFNFLLMIQLRSFFIIIAILKNTTRNSSHFRLKTKSQDESNKHLKISVTLKQVQHDVLFT